MISIAALVMTIGASLYMHAYKYSFPVLVLGLIHVILIMSLWWRDVIREATFEGMHTRRVQAGLRLGFLLFIVSEVMFFFGFFWAFFHSALAGSDSLSFIWPPEGIILLIH